LNGYSFIYFMLYIIAQPRLGNILYKVIISKGLRKVLQTTKFNDRNLETYHLTNLPSYHARVNIHIPIAENFQYLWNTVYPRPIVQFQYFACHREECVFYILKLLKSIFIVIGKIKEAIVVKMFPGGACRTTLTCSHFKVPQVQSETLNMYQIIHPTLSFATSFLAHLTQRVRWAIAITWCPSSSSVVRRKLFQKISHLKVLDQWKPNLVWIITRVSSFKIVSRDAVHQPTWPLLLKIEHMVKLQVLGNNSKTVNNIKNLTR
jgi:hypothetical protein